MAQRRMFSPQIVGSDAFLEMPVSGRELYFQLGMYADDDGFVNPKKIVRMVGASDDDLKVLIAKKFVIPFDSGVVVVKHWRMNNQIRLDRYHETQYTREKASLFIRENGSYSTHSDNALPLIAHAETRWQPDGNQMAPEVRLGKVSIGKNTDTPRGKRVDALETPKMGTLEGEVIDAFKELNPSYKNLFKRKVQHEAARRLLELHGLERIKKVVGFVVIRAQDRFCPAIATPVQLEEKWGLLEQYGAKLRAGTGKGKEIIGLDA